MLCALHRSRVSAPFLEKSPAQSAPTDVDQIVASIAKDVSFAAGGTAEAELFDNGAALFDSSCSIAESQVHGDDVSSLQLCLSTVCLLGALLLYCMLCSTLLLQWALRCQDSKAQCHDSDSATESSGSWYPQVRVVWRGELSNYDDICELYITPTELTVTHDCARLMLTLYLEVRIRCSPLTAYRWFSSACYA